MVMIMVIILPVIILPLAFYFLFAYIAWISNDPFNIVNKNELSVLDKCIKSYESKL